MGASDSAANHKPQPHVSRVPLCAYKARVGESTDRTAKRLNATIYGVARKAKFSHCNTKGARDFRIIYVFKTVEIMK